MRTALLTGRYNVIDVDRASEALKIAEPIDLLIVDFYLPDLRGHQLAADLVKKHPSLPVIIISGREMDIAQIREIAIFGGQILYKPFGMQALLKVVQDVLSESSS
jgi:DNA-binding response OmpR family regulator